MSKKSLLVLSSIIALVLGLANSSSHPTSGNSGYTGAPGDSVCTSCHSGSNANFNGEISISGLPTTVMTNTTYTLTVTISNPNGNASRAGFQLIALTGSNTNAGSMNGNSANTQIKTVGGKNYFGHSPSSTFIGNQNLVFTTNWTSPSTTGSNPVINFYASALLANGNGSTSGDKTVLTNLSVPIQAPASPLSVNVVTVTNTSCSNTNDGSASVNITGGMGPYTINWSSGQANTQTVTNLPSGLVSVTVTDAAGASASGSTNILSPPSITINTNSSPSCANSATGTATAQAAGGTGSLSYFWSNGMQGASISSLQPANYTVSVFDANNCLQTSSVTVGSVPQINISEAVQNVLCNGGNNGVININASGGNGNFTYQWSNGQTTSSIGNLIAGSYTVTVTSNNQCSTIRTININQPLPFVSVVQNTAGAGCDGQSNGAVTIANSGGTAPYQTTIQNVGNFAGSVINPQGLSAGTYSYTVTDQNNCVTSGSFQITSFPAVSASIEVLYNVCDDDCFITATAIVSVGTPPYNYFWCNGVPSQTTILNCLSDCAVTISDQNGCTAIVNVNINPPQPLKIDTILIAQPLCNGNTGSAEIQISGGVGDINFVWSDGGTGPLRANIPAGQYIVYASDANMCTVSDTINLSEPDFISVNVIITDATEQGTNDGSIQLEISGGVAPYTVLWNTGHSGIIYDSIPSGIYFYTITDNNNCTLTGSVIVNNSFCFISAEAEYMDPSCFGGTNGQIIIVSVPEEHEPVIRLFDMNGAALINFDSLIAGIYSLLIIDTLGCTGVINGIIINNPLQIVADSIVEIPPSSDMSSDGQLKAYIQGGTGPLIYQWYLNDFPYSNNSQIENLPNGIYHLVVTDSLGCEATFGPFNFLLVGNKENDNIGKTKLYPNPVGDYLIVDFHTAVWIKSIEVLSLDGQCLQQFHINQVIENSIKVSMENINTGLYLLRLEADATHYFRVLKL